MRMMFTSTPAAGHLRPLLPIAYAALRWGHEVVFCTPESGRGLVDGFGMRHLCAGVDWVGPRLRELSTTPGTREELRSGFHADITAEGLAGDVALSMAKDVIAAAQTWRPDVVVRESGEFGGSLAAEALGVPHVSVGALGGKADHLATLLAPALDSLRATLGLPADPRGERVHAYLHASLVPPEIYPTPSRVPNTTCYCQTNPLLPGETLPESLTAGLGDRPRVLVSFGTIVPGTGAFDDVVPKVIAGIAEVDCLAVAVGACDPDTLPDNVRATDWIAQTLMLESCDLSVTHGGFNSTREALRTGVPMVAVPWLVDQRANAARCADLGAAIVLDPDDLTPSAVRDACRTVLADPGYRRSARALQRGMVALPGMDRLVTDIEALTA